MSCLSFSPSHRLLDRRDFLLCYDVGERRFTKFFVLFIAKREVSNLPWRLGIAVTRKSGSAVRRNRLRRVIREVFRLSQNCIPQGYDFVVIPKRKTDIHQLEFLDVSGDITSALQALSKNKQS